MYDLVLTFLVLASGIVANKYVLLSMSPDLLVGIRMTVAGLLLVLYSVRGSSRLRWDYIRHDSATLFFITFCTTLIPALLKSYALTMIPASKQTLLGSIDPFITAIYAYLLYGERVTWRKLGGMAIGFSGIALAVSTSFPGEAAWGEWFSISLPELAVFLAVALGRYGWMLLQGLMKAERYRPHEITGLSMLISGFLALVLSLVRGGTFTVPEIGAWRWVTALCYTTFIGNLGGYTAYGYCLRRHSATTVAMVGLSMPLLVAGIGLLFGLDTITWKFCAATALVSVGMIIFYSDQKKQMSRITN